MPSCLQETLKVTVIQEVFLLPYSVSSNPSILASNARNQIPFLSSQEMKLSLFDVLQQLPNQYCAKLLQLSPPSCTDTCIHLVEDRYDFTSSTSLKADEGEKRLSKTQLSREYFPTDRVKIPD